MTFCTRCGNQINAAEQFCAKCGARVRNEARIELVKTVSGPNVPAAIQYPQLSWVSILLAGVGLVVVALGTANISFVFAHVVLTRLLYTASGIGPILIGVAVLVAFNWASARSLGASAILIGVGLVISGTWSLAFAIDLHEQNGSFYYPSTTVQNISSGVSMGGWIVAALGVFLTLKKVTTR